MFYPSSNHGIEQDFIKPVLKSSRDIDSLTSIAESEAFCCSLSIEELSQKGNTGAIAWINKFKYGFNEVGKPLPEVLKIKNGYWYTMHDTEMADFVTSVNPDKRIFISRLNEKSFVNQRLIRFTSLKSDTDLELSHALLNSLMGIFFIEALGFGRGLGALDLSSNRMKKYFRMLNPSLLTDSQIKEIKNKFALFKNRDVQNIRIELNDSIRKDFDLTVLKAYEIEHLYDSIKSSFLFLFNMRNK